MVQKNQILQLFVIAAVAWTAFGFTVADHITILTTTAEDITVAWDPVSNADGYRWEIINQERAMSVFAQGETVQTQITVKMPKTGHNIFRIKAFNAEGESDWATSTDPAFATVGGQPRSWWIFAWVEKPTGGF